MKIRSQFLLFLVSLSIAGCAQQPSLSFSEERCDSSIDPYSAPRADIIHTTWVAAEELEVVAYIKTFCGGATIMGGFQLTNSDLLLTYKILAPGPVTSCNCAHKVRYHFTDIPPLDYSITIIEAQ